MLKKLLQHKKRLSCSAPFASPQGCGFREDKQCVPDVPVRPQHGGPPATGGHQQHPRLHRTLVRGQDRQDVRVPEDPLQNHENRRCGLFGHQLHGGVQTEVSWTNFYFEGLYFTKKLYMKNFNIKNTDNKISQGRGNSLRNEVRGWVGQTVLAFIYFYYFFFVMSFVSETLKSWI